MKIIFADINSLSPFKFMGNKQPSVYINAMNDCRPGNARLIPPGKHLINNGRMVKYDLTVENVDASAIADCGIKPQ